MSLEYNGSTLDDETLDLLIQASKELNVPPSYLITKLHYESLWGNSPVARENNNLSGMTWTGETKRPSGVIVSQGSPRPTNEGGFYMKYASLEDFFKDWLFLIRRGGAYNVADSQTFDEAVKGMFKVGGATYDYATMNVNDSQERYELYLKGMQARRNAINSANDGALDQLDQGERVETVATASQIINRAVRNLGVTKGDKYHKQIVDGYNSKSPKPMGYTATYSDDWCDIFVTWVFDKEGASNLIGRECGVQRHKAILQQKGIWLGRVRPSAGDVVIFDWQGHSAGWADHIGIVEKVQGNTVHTIEGNSGNPRMVRRVSYPWNHNAIVGYARPRYSGSSQQAPSQPKTNGKKVTIAKHATHWQTGEKIADHVKGKTFEVVNEKKVNQSSSRKAFLLHDGKYYIGWLLEQDAVGFKPYKSNTEIAQEVINGKWGNNPQRAKKLSDAGYNAQEVQKEVNRLIKEQNSKKPQETIKPAPIEKQQIGGEKINLADNEVLLDGVVYVINRK